VQCMLCLKKSPLQINDHLKSKFFEILDKTANVHKLDCNNCTIAYDESGNQLPYLMRAWLDGSLSCSTIRTYVAEATKTHPEWFGHLSEQRAVCNLINIIFTPERFVKTRTIYQECITFIKACKKQGHRVFALSNWDKESFVLLQKQFPHVFNLFDGIVISGDVHTLKPCADIYELLLNRYNLKPDTCWFIDDQQENVTAASSLGIHGVICYQTSHKKPNFRRVAQTIRSMIRLKNDTDVQAMATALS
jgi:HAD superfamily hydrolase (TIGR01549 family)